MYEHTVNVCEIKGKQYRNRGTGEKSRIIKVVGTKI